MWQQLFAKHLGLETGRPDATDLVRWSLDANRVKRYESLAPEFQNGLRERVVESAGALGSVLADAIGSGHGSLLMPIGLVCEVLFVEGGRGGSNLAQAVARLEPFLGGNTLRSELGRAWSGAACHVLDRMSEEERRGWLERAEQLLDELKAAGYAGFSRVLLSGFEQRLAAFAKGLEHCLDGKSSVSGLEPLSTKRCNIGSRKPRPSRSSTWRWRCGWRAIWGLTGPVRRERWGRDDGTGAAGRFVDWARRYLLGGDRH